MTARALGPDDLGVLSLASTIIGWCSVIFGLGLNLSIGRFIGENIGRPDIVRRGFRWTVRLGIWAGSVGAGLLVLSSFPLGRQILHQPKLILVLIILAVCLPFDIIKEIGSKASLGFGLVKENVFILGIVVPVSWTIMVGLAWALKLGLYEMAWIMTISTIVAGLGSYLSFRSKVGGWSRSDLPFDGRPIVNIALVLLISNLAYSIWLKLDNLFLGLFWTSREIGLYAPAFQTSYLLTYLNAAISALFSPTVATLLSKGQNKELNNLSQDASSWCLYGNLSLAITLFLGAEPFLGLFGADFVAPEAITALRILVVFFLIYSLIGAMPFILLAMGGKQRYLAKIEAFLIFCAMLFHFVFTRSYGVIGAAISTGLALTVAGLLRCFAVKRAFGFLGIDRSIWKAIVVAVGAYGAAQGSVLLLPDVVPVVKLGIIFLSATGAEMLMLLATRERSTLSLLHAIARRLQQRSA